MTGLTFGSTRASKTIGKFLVIAGTITLAGCDLPYVGPKLIVADDETFIACGTFVWVTQEGDTFSVSFTDGDGLAQSLHGIKKVTVSDPPKPTAWKNYSCNTR